MRQLELFSCVQNCVQNRPNFIPIEDVAGAIVHKLYPQVRTKRDVILKVRKVAKELLNGGYEDESIFEDVEVKIISLLDELPEDKLTPSDLKKFFRKVLSALCLSYLGRSEYREEGYSIIGKFTPPLWHSVCKYFSSLGFDDFQAENIAICYFETVGLGKETSSSFLKKVYELKKLRDLQQH